AFVDGSRVWIRLADYFARPLRLTAAEGLLLYSGARALKSSGAGDDALDRAIKALEQALGPDVLSRVSVELEGAGELATVREGLLTRRRLHLVYYAHSRTRRPSATSTPGPCSSPGAAGTWSAGVIGWP